MSSSNLNVKKDIQPIAFWKQLLIFGLPGLTIYLSVHHLVLVMTQAGIDLIFSWTLAVVGPTFLNAVIILGIYFYTHRPSWSLFKRRFRLHKPKKAFIWQVPLTAVVIVILNELFVWTIPLLKNIPLLSPPELIPEIFSDVYETIKNSENTTFMGETVSPVKWWLLPFWIIFWVFIAVFGEEIVWRGFVLPRQEKNYGRWAWLINGLLWNIPFHLYTMHNFFSDMPLYLLLPFLVQKTQNSWFGIAVHALLVSLALILLIPGII